MSMQLSVTFTEFIAALTGHAIEDLPVPAESGSEWREVLDLWLAQLNFGLVPVADPYTFSWAGHWIGIIDSPDEGSDGVAVLLFGTPPAVISSPSAPALIGKAVEELRFQESFVLAPFQPLPSLTSTTSRRSGEVVGIYLTEVKTSPIESVPVATALAGRGLLGDRYAAKAGTFSPQSDKLRGYDLTLIESEVLDRLTLPDGSHLAPEETRRNVVTRGIDLNALVGREFRIGSVRLFGQRLCEPCVHLQRLTRPGVVAGLVHQGGLQADVLTDGEIRVGDRIMGDGITA
jgi:hypothetical protein